MLEHPANQASGLQGLQSIAGAQLIGMVRHGDELAELPLLWRLCSALVSLGYPVTVLDANKTESDNNPGLEQLLEHQFGPRPEGHDAPDWTVLPACRGMRHLCHFQSPTQSLDRLGQLFQSVGVVILYGNAELLTQLLQGSRIKPLLAVSSAKSSLLTSYLALKRLLVQGHLEPTILNVMAPTRAYNEEPGVVTANLRECAKNYLGYEVKALSIDPKSDEPKLNAAVRHLAAVLLEHAQTLTRNPNAAHGMRIGDHAPQSAWSH
jgi:hypothetical protein